MCKYCCKGPEKEMIDKGPGVDFGTGLVDRPWEIYIIEGTNILEFNVDYIDYSFKINFCPMCGEDLRGRE